MKLTEGSLFRPSNPFKGRREHWKGRAKIRRARSGEKGGTSTLPSPHALSPLSSRSLGQANLKVADDATESRIGGKQR